MSLLAVVSMAVVFSMPLDSAEAAAKKPQKLVSLNKAKTAEGDKKTTAQLNKSARFISLSNIKKTPRQAPAKAVAAATKHDHDHNHDHADATAKQPVEGIAKYAREADGAGKGGLASTDEKSFYADLGYGGYDNGSDSDSLTDEDYAELNLDIIENDLLDLLKPKSALGESKADKKNTKLLGLLGKKANFGEVTHVWPVATGGRVTSAFGSRRDPMRGTKAFHDGLDIAAPLGTAVIASAEGVIARIGQHRNLGRFVQVLHRDGTYSLYGHLKSATVKERQRVGQGDKIGIIGVTGRTTGPHLHYSLRVDSKPVNPMAFLSPYGSSIAAATKTETKKPVNLLARFGSSS